ncbi:MAG: hypothetical protein HRT57_12600, partial [Crocinitomicaceae bacterium]|nr:hypothetical protein [Crocinitomicaceae bacterium]
MKKPNHDLTLRVGHVSDARELGKFYQDFSEALHHFDENYFGDKDAHGIPMFGFGENAVYNQIYIIQYGLISYDLIHDGVNIEENTARLEKCVQWLENNEEQLNGALIWRNHFPNIRYGLPSGWMSGMYQGQAISLLLRYGQLINQEEKYVNKSLEAFKFFHIDYEDGGVKRIDSEGNFWLEEYPGTEPSFVLNGFVYTFLGIYDLWRVSKDPQVEKMMNDCIDTLINSLHKYDSGFWSIYDQQKKELATKYYHKNIHI